MNEKVRENRVRRMADRQGLALHKSRRRDPLAKDYGEMWLRWLDSPHPEDQHDAWIGPFYSTDDVELLLTLPRDVKELPDALAHVTNVERYLRGGGDAS